MSKRSSPRPFEEYDFYAPFGRYEGSRDAPAPRHAFLVGRGRERAHFLDLLYMKSGLGSYLVTGVRGVGKTSFVHYCIHTYVRDVYERYCRSQVGRSLVDKVSVFFALVLPFVSIIALTPVVATLWKEATPKSAVTGLVLLAGTTLLTLLALAPLGFAYRTRRSLTAYEIPPGGGSDPRCRMARITLVPFVATGMIEGFVANASWPWAYAPVALEGVACFVAAAWLHLISRGDGWKHTKGNLEKLLTRAQRLAEIRVLVLASISASFMVSLVVALFGKGDPSFVWWKELLVAGVCGLALPSLILIEKLWLLQPGRRMVFETAIHPLQGVDVETQEVSPKDLGKEGENSERIARSVEDTLFYALFRRWLPVLRVNINLGLDRLSHAHIIESMLRGLHEQLRATFGNPFAFTNQLKYAFLAGLWLFLMHVPPPHLSDLFKPSETRSAESERKEANKAPPKENSSKPSAPAGTAPPAKKDDSATKSDPAWVLTVPRSSNGERRLADFLLPPRIDLLWGAFLWLGLALVRGRVAWLPHHRAGRKIELLLESLSSRVTIENASGQGKLTKLAGVELATPTRRRTVQTDPRDPRSLERAFFEVLETIQKPKRTIVPGLKLSLPAPETIFIFDELDKVGTTTTLLDPGLEANPAYPHDIERERSRQLQALLSDLKNLLGTARARFIFVGGRNLHDEWLADEVNRQPLLSNIFDAEIYVRTLLTDGEPEVSQSQGADGSVGPRGNADSVPMSLFTLSVRHYFDVQHARAINNWEQWGRSAGAGHRDYGLEILRPSYVRGRLRGDRMPTVRLPELQPMGEGAAIERKTKREFWDAFMCFLTFRSRGIPRRARLILETFVRPSDRVVALRSGKGQSSGSGTKDVTSGRGAQHVLFFADHDRVRIELVSELYRAIEGAPSGLRWRDDKVLMAVFQFADFLTRFHRRAFSLQSLERFEELMHVHRAPDTSMLAARLIADWLGTLLEATAAGIHAYRFRVEWAAEIAHLSSLSQHESASANFTLDETQALKAQLRSLLSTVSGTGGAFEVHTALAELHDLDGDHLDARHHFRKAIDILDARLQQEFVSGGADGRGAVARVLGSDQMDRQLDWALARLRVMLQLGLTYERTFDYERAGLEYGNALQVAQAVWKSKGKLLPTLKSSASALVEPIFAQAWAALKDPVVIEPPFWAAGRWLSDLLLGEKPEIKANEACWERLVKRACERGQWSRELNMLGDLALFSVPRWGEQQLELAQAAYATAAKVARVAREEEQQARSEVSLALCHLMGNRDSSQLEWERMRRFVEAFARAQSFAVAAPSSQGPFSDSTAVHHLGLEIVEELWLAVRAGASTVSATQFREKFKELLIWPAEVPGISNLRKRILKDACWRLRDVVPEWNSRIPHSFAFPVRNRFLNLRSLLWSEGRKEEGFPELLKMWSRFDSRSTLAPCRIAIAAPKNEEAKSLWYESRDINQGGKRYFAWLRDRYYLEDGFGPMLVRANFALTIGLAQVHQRVAGLPEGFPRRKEPPRPKDAPPPKDHPAQPKDRAGLRIPAAPTAE